MTKNVVSCTMASAIALIVATAPEAGIADHGLFIADRQRVAHNDGAPKGTIGQACVCGKEPLSTMQIAAIRFLHSVAHTVVLGKIWFAASVKSTDARKRREIRGFVRRTEQVRA